MDLTQAEKNPGSAERLAPMTGWKTMLPNPGANNNNERILQPIAPPVLPDNPNQAEIAPRCGVNAAAGVKLD
jgi:hypothetical protein